MKRSKLVVLLMLLSLAFSWFVSVGVVSAENPWDADSPGGPSSSDTTTSPTTDLRPGGTNDSGDGFDAFQDWLVHVFFAVYMQTLGASPVSTVAADDGEKSQTTTSTVRK